MEKDIYAPGRPGISPQWTSSSKTDVGPPINAASRIWFTLTHGILLGTNGIFVFTGIPGIKAKVEIAADRIMKSMVLKNQVIFGTVNASQSAFESAILDLDQFHQCWPMVLKSMITTKFEPEHFAQVLQGPLQGIKNVITFGDT